MRVEPPSRLGRNDYLLASRLAHLANQLLRVTIAINVCRIDKVNAQVDGLVKRCQRALVIRWPPLGATDAPCSKTDCRYLPASPAKRTVLHEVSFLLSLF